MDDQQPVTNALPPMQGTAPTFAPPQTPQVTQAPPNPQAVAQIAQVAHDSAFGRLAKSLMGQSNQYSVGPDGTLQNNPTPVSGSQMFRAVLGAGLAGMAAGASHPEQGFAGGFARGAGAGVQQAQQVDQQKRQQAQQDFKDQQLVQQQNRENQLMQAQVANMHSEMAGRQHTSDLQDQAAHDRHNAASAAVLNTLTAAGGTPAIIPVNGKAASDFTAPDLAAAYVKDPSILKAPNGFIRHFVDTTDSSELTYNGTNWVDASGQPVNMTDRTTVKAIDVPVNAMTTKIPVSGKDINNARGSKLVDPDGTYQMSPFEIDALNTKRMTDAKAQAAIDRDNETARHNKAMERNQAGELAVRQGELKLKQSGGLSGGDLAPAADPKNVGTDGVNHVFLDAVAQTNPKHADLLKAIGEGREIPSNYMLARKEGQALMADVHAAYPDYDFTKSAGYQKLRTSYQAGKDKDQLEAIDTSYRHLAQAYHNASNPLAIVPGTPAHAIYNSDTDQLKEEINSAYTHGVLTKEKSESLEGDLQSSIPATRRAAIREVFGLLSDKTEEKQRTWQRGKPSAAIPDFSFISPEAQTAYHYVTGKTISPTGELNNPENGRPNVSQAARAPYAPPAGSFAGRDGSGNIVRYKLPNGTVVDAKTGQPVGQ